MNFAFIGCATDYYVSLQDHFAKMNNQFLIYTPIDALLNETFIDNCNAIIIDYDSHSSSYNLKLTQFLKVVYPNIPIFILISQNTSMAETLLSLGVVSCLEKTLPAKEIIEKIQNASERVTVVKELDVQIGKDYIFDMSSLVLRYKNIALPLTKNEITFIHYLIQNRDHYISLYDISHLIYPNSSIIKHVAIRSFLMRLRKKLKEDLIENFPRLGYRLKPLPELA